MINQKDTNSKSMKVRITKAELQARIWKESGKISIKGVCDFLSFLPDTIIVEGEEKKEWWKYGRSCFACGGSGRIAPGEKERQEPSEIEGLWKKIDDIFWEHTIYISKKDNIIDFDKVLVDSYKIKEELVRAVNKITKER